MTTWLEIIAHPFVHIFMILLNEPYGMIEYDESIPAIIAHYHGYMTSEQFRSFLMKGTEFIADKSKLHDTEIVWIANTKDHTIQSPDDTLWASEEWNPVVYKYGVRHLGFVIPEKLFGLSAVENYTRSNYIRKENVLEVMMFNELENARKWYKKMIRENYSKPAKKQAGRTRKS